MKRGWKGFLCASVFVVFCAPGGATVTILSVTPSAKPPQAIGTAITWTVTATDTNPGPLTFQFNVAPPGGSLALVKDFNAGTLSAGTWTAQPWVWVPTGMEGKYQIQVIAKDFGFSESATFNGSFQVTPLVAGTMPVVKATANPVVALFSAPSCPSGSSMRVEFQRVGSTAANSTNWVKCHPPATMTFEIGGMYPSTAYNMFSQTKTGTTITPGSTVTFTTGALPTNVPFPTFKINIPAGSNTDKKDGLLLHSPHRFGGGSAYPMVATDLAGKIIWYYYTNPPVNIILTRPLPGGVMFLIEDGPAWNPATTSQQLLRQIDLAGNVIRETNTGVIQQQLLALGASDAGPCNNIPSPAPVGSACLGSFHHDAIQTLPNGDIALLVDIEKIFPVGTQGSPSTLPVDIVGDMIVVLNSSWQVIWYFDTFAQLDVNRAAILGETCGINQAGCPPMLLLGTGIAPLANDWLHANSLYYWPQNGDLILSIRDQDWVVKIDYNNGAGTKNILWRMGPGGDFAFNNIFSDPWPWFSGQHEVDLENNGAGPMTLFDNGNTRIAPPPLGLGSGNSRGMALTVDETNMTVTPVLSADLGVYSPALGSAQLLSDGNYFFMAGEIFVNLNSQVSNSLEILPTAGTDTGTQVYNLQGAQGYRAWQMPSLYAPPIT